MKTIIITGTSKGIGKEVALHLLEKNFTILGISNKHNINHKNYYPITYDLNNTKDIKKVIDGIISQHKKIDSFISNAGYGIFDNLENISEEKIKDFFNVNLIAHILLSKHLVTHFKKKKTGYFIFIGSEAAIKSSKKATLYSSAKHGLLGFVKSFREECNKSNIRVTIINPGMVKTNFFKNLNFEPGKNIQNYINKNDLAQLIDFLLKSNSNINYNDISLSPIKKVIRFKK